MPWIIGGLAAVGAIGGGLISKSGQKDANESSAASTREMMDFQREMSDTAVQRRVKDLRAAGLNPMLGYTQQASTPSGGATTFQNENVGLGQGVAAAGQSAHSAQSLALMKAQTAQTEAQTAKTVAEAKVVEAAVPYSSYSAKMSAEKLGFEVKHAAEQLNRMMSDADIRDLDLVQARKVYPLLEKLRALEVKSAEMGVPFLENMSEAQRSWWMREVSPYLPDFLKSMGGVGAAKGVLK